MCRLGVMYWKRDQGSPALYNGIADMYFILFHFTYFVELSLCIFYAIFLFMRLFLYSFLYTLYKPNLYSFNIYMCSTLPSFYMCAVVNIQL